jgi:hypothetical protein
MVRFPTHGRRGAPMVLATYDPVPRCSDRPLPRCANVRRWSDVATTRCTRACADSPTARCAGDPLDPATRCADVRTLGAIARSTDAPSPHRPNAPTAMTRLPPKSRPDAPRAITRRSFRDSPLGPLDAPFEKAKRHSRNPSSPCNSIPIPTVTAKTVSSSKIFFRRGDPARSLEPACF